MAVEVRPTTRAGELAEFARNLRYEQLPKEVVAKAKMHILDALGIAIASSKFDFAQAVIQTVRGWGGEQQATVIGTGDRVPAVNAALANGTMVHGLDYDDTHMDSIVHVSASVVPTALAVGEARNISGKELLAAIVAGNEVATRIGYAAAGKFHDRGFHMTPIAGTFAAGAIAGKVFGLTLEQMTWALGICGSQANGLQEFLEDGSSVKRLHPGWASHSGIAAAQFAGNGLTAPPRILEGRWGLYNVMLGPGNFIEERLTAGLGSDWKTLDISFKPYPCCHLLHAFVDAARILKRQEGLDPNDIEAVQAKIAPTPMHILCEPPEAKYEPPTTYAAMFSLPYTVALGFVEEQAGLDMFTPEKIKDRRLLDLARKVTWAVDEESDYPKHFPGYVKVTMKGGQTFEYRERFNKGCPDNPVSMADIEEKFRQNAGMTMDTSKQDRVVAAVNNLENLAAAGDLAKLLH